VSSAQGRPAAQPAARAIVDSVGAQGEVKRLLEVRVPDLIDYQDEAYAKRYAEVIKRVVAAEQRALPGSQLSEAAARYLYKLMAFKDEFEVARLHTDPAFLAQLDAQFKHGYTVKYNLAPPLLAERDPKPATCRRSSTVSGCSRPSSSWPSASPAWRRPRHLQQDRRASQERQSIEDYIKVLDEIISASAQQPRRRRGPGQRAGRDPRLRPREGEEPGQGPKLQAERLEAFRNPARW
jgi:indolepyruvate ferredoxin oxidoreductase